MSPVSNVKDVPGLYPFEEALEDLQETIIAQVTYAIDHHQTLDHVFMPAEPHYFELHFRSESQTTEVR